MNLVAGIGFNDLAGETTCVEDGSRVRIPSYAAWHSMLYRTVRNKNYGDVSIHPDLFKGLIENVKLMREKI